MSVPTHLLNNLIFAVFHYYRVSFYNFMIINIYKTHLPLITPAWRTWWPVISNWKPHKLWNARLMFPNIPKRRFIIIILSDTLNPGQSHHISQLAMNADNSNSNFDNTIEEEIADALNRSAIGNFCALLSIFRLVAENVLPILRNSNTNHNIQVDTLTRARHIAYVSI